MEKMIFKLLINIIIDLNVFCTSVEANISNNVSLKFIKIQHAKKDKEDTKIVKQVYN